jgi:hypothetical protein
MAFSPSRLHGKRQNIRGGGPQAARPPERVKPGSRQPFRTHATWTSRTLPRMLYSRLSAPDPASWDHHHPPARDTAGPRSEGTCSNSRHLQDSRPLSVLHFPLARPLGRFRFRPTRRTPQPDRRSMAIPRRQQRHVALRPARSSSLRCRARALVEPSGRTTTRGSPRSPFSRCFAAGRPIAKAS